MPCFVRCLSVAVILLAWSPLAHAADDCAQASGREQVQCLSDKIDAADTVLDTLYSAVLAKLPDNDPSDTRKSKAQLVKAEDAWRNYVDQNCAYIGAAEGGSNLWVTNFMARCQLDEIRKRIDFFRFPTTAGN
jgi:uncharacterized protein YecT (DUF1311 family)